MPTYKTLRIFIVSCSVLFGTAAGAQTKCSSALELNLVQKYIEQVTKNNPDDRLTAVNESTVWLKVSPALKSINSIQELRALVARQQAAETAWYSLPENILESLNALADSSKDQDEYKRKLLTFVTLSPALRRAGKAAREDLIRRLSFSQSHSYIESTLGIWLDENAPEDARGYFASDSALRIITEFNKGLQSKDAAAKLRDLEIQLQVLVSPPDELIRQVQEFAIVYSEKQRAYRKSLFLNTNARSEVQNAKDAFATFVRSNPFFVGVSAEAQSDLINDLGKLTDGADAGVRLRQIGSHKAGSDELRAQILDLKPYDY